MQATGVGQSGRFHWWEGVVEDNLDPTGAGRCRVRVIAHNSPSKADLPTDKLPWAYPMMPVSISQESLIDHQLQMFHGIRNEKSMIVL